MSEYVRVAAQSAKEQYMNKVWAMSHEQLFHELMRVHTESAKLLSQAQAEVDRLKELLDGETGLERPQGDGPMARGNAPGQTEAEDGNDARIVLPHSKG